MINDELNLANTLRNARIKAGLTQKQVAEKMNLKCEDRLSHWEHGQALPDATNLLKLSRVLNIDINNLIKGEFLL